MIENGIPDANISMFDTNTTERDEWIDQYNNQHLPKVCKEFQSKYGHLLKLPLISKEEIISIQIKQEETATMTENTYSSSNLPEIGCKRDYDQVSYDEPSMKKMKTNQNEIECINNFSDEDIINSPILRLNVSDSEQIVLGIPENLSESDDNDSNKIHSNNKKVSKQVLNLNATKTNIFRPRYQKRHRVKLYEKKKNKVDDIEIEKKLNQHPLFINDPLNKMEKDKLDKLERETFEGEHCLYWVANGYCKYFGDDGCRYLHEKKFAAKRFYCFMMEKYKRCGYNNCKFTHKLKDVPCLNYYEMGGCGLNDECAKSHEFGKEEYDEWMMAKVKREKARKKLKMLKNGNRNKNKSYYR